MIILPMKKKWFDMVKSGEKSEEYREIRPYYTARFLKVLGFPKTEQESVMELLRLMEAKNVFWHVELPIFSGAIPQN